MKQFQYLLLDTSSSFFGNFDYEELNEHLNQLGSQGWEVVSVTGLDVGQGRTADLLITLKRELLAG